MPFSWILGFSCWNFLRFLYLLFFGTFGFVLMVVHQGQLAMLLLLAILGAEFLTATVRPECRSAYLTDTLTVIMFSPFRFSVGGLLVLPCQTPTIL